MKKWRVVCLTCEAVVLADSPRRRFCSERCRWRHRAPLIPPHPYVCQDCGAEGDTYSRQRVRCAACAQERNRRRMRAYMRARRARLRKERVWNCGA